MKELTLLKSNPFDMNPSLTALQEEKEYSTPTYANPNQCYSPIEASFDTQGKDASSSLQAQKCIQTRENSVATGIQASTKGFDIGEIKEKDAEANGCSAQRIASEFDTKGATRTLRVPHAKESKGKRESRAQKYTKLKYLLLLVAASSQIRRAQAQTDCDIIKTMGGTESLDPDCCVVNTAQFTCDDNKRITHM
jgi:outer membrane translocation and assembly module TamA